MKIRIPQCTCDDTDMKVRHTLQRVEGINKVDSNPEAQNAIIVYDDSKINFEKIRDLLLQERVTILGKPEYLK
jgi:copper chaperone CopZ